jgi:hypothetical protein
MRSEPGKLIWQGEAPGPIGDFSEGAGGPKIRHSAEPIRSPSRGFPCLRSKRVRRAVHRETLETGDTADRRLGTCIGLARPGISPASVASLKVSGHAGASPQQISLLGFHRVVLVPRPREGSAP